MDNKGDDDSSWGTGIYKYDYFREKVALGGILKKVRKISQDTDDKGNGSILFCLPEV